MQRIPEPELMDDAEQALAYSQADFSEPNNAFIDGLIETIGDLNHKTILDIGCGPGDICKMLAERFPDSKITGIDGSQAMLDLANQTQTNNITFQKCLLPDTDLPAQHFDIIISNSLLHHLHHPEVLWQTIRHCGKNGALVYVMDLFRMPSKQAAHDIVEQYAADGAEVLKVDFYNSLLAAFTVDEVTQQLQQAGLENFTITPTSDRHMVIKGALRA